jgi:hypothetical protein
VASQAAAFLTSPAPIALLTQIHGKSGESGGEGGGGSTPSGDTTASQPQPTSTGNEPVPETSAPEQNYTPAEEPTYTPNPNIRPHGEQPKINGRRPPGMQSHHPEQQTALARNIANYDPDEDPTLLLPTPQHYATYGPQAAQRATGATFEEQLGTPAALDEAAQIMAQAGVTPETAGQTVLEHSGYLFSTTPADEVLMCLPANANYYETP